MKGLTDRQREVFEFIVDYLRDCQMPPTMREIGEALNITSPNGVQSHLRYLEAKGYIRRRNNGVSRGIEIVKSETCPCCGQPWKGQGDGLPAVPEAR